MSLALYQWPDRRSVSYSTSYTSGLPDMMSEFHVSSEPLATLGVTAYLFGLAIGSLLLAPLSETYGRKPAYMGGMLVYILMIIPAAKATSLAEIIIVRFFGAVGGSVMIANSPGTISDIATEKYQALAFSIWGIGPLNGPGGYSMEELRDSGLTFCSDWACHWWFFYAVSELAVD